MALLSPRLHRFRLLTKLHQASASKPTNANQLTVRRKTGCCYAIAVDAPSSLTDAAGIRWGSTTLQGLREEMEDDAVVRSDGLNGFLFAAVFDGHGGCSSVKFLRWEPNRASCGEIFRIYEHMYCRVEASFTISLVYS